MSSKRIGERLRNMVPLSTHDIEEILSEQGSTGKRFGDIALELGLCQPEHIWQAWGSQLAEAPQRIDLDHVGIDAQAVNCVTRDVAVRYHVMPVRILGDVLVLAIDEAAFPQIQTELSSVIRGKVLFVLSNHKNIARLIRSYYPQSSAA